MHLGKCLFLFCVVVFASSWTVFGQTGNTGAERTVESSLADRIAELPREADRKALIETNKTIPPNLLIAALNEKGRSTVFTEPFIAIRVLETALGLSASTGNDTYLKSILPNLGLAYRQVRDYQRSSAYFRQAIDYFKTLDNDDMMSRLGMELGVNYAMLGDYQSSISPIATRLAYLERAGNKTGLLDTFINLSTFYGRAGDRFHQLGFLVRAQSVADHLSKNDPTALKSDRVASVFNGLGNAYRDLGQTERAIEYYKQSLEFGPPELDAGPLQNLGDLYFSNSENATAREYYSRSWQSFQSSKNKIGMANALEKIGDTYAEENAFDKALEWHQKALQIRVEMGGFNQMNRLKIGNDLLKLGNLDGALATAEAVAFDPKNRSYPNVLIVSNILAGRVQRAKGDESASSKFIDAAFTVAEEENKRYTGYGFGQPAGLRSPYYEKVVVHFRKRQFKEAFAFAERDKARALLSVLVDGRVDVYGSMSAEDQRTEKRLKEDLISLNAQIAFLSSRPRPDTRRIGELNETLVQAQARFQAFQIYVNRAHPELAAQRAQMDSIAFDDVAAIMPNSRTVFLELVIADDRLILFALGKADSGQLELKASDIAIDPKLLAERVGQFRTKLASGDLDFQKLSRELYDLLLKPVEKELKGKTNLIIVPDGPLWDLPFQALMDRSGRYLVEKAAISYAPSLTALREMAKNAKKQRPSAGAELIAFGNPSVDEGTKERVRRVFMNEKLEPLPEAERLVNELAKMYGPQRSRVFVGNNAREERAKSEAPKYRIVQFATHGILNDASPMYSHLVLAQEGKNQGEDGLLEAWELKDLSLNADMVILSACDTARGRVSGGEGIIGMTWATFIAGASATVASQWKVESRSTTELMLEFHRQLLSGKVSKAEALRRAALKLKRTREFSHPSYWAGFIVVGDAN